MKALEGLMNIRLFREENPQWIEKAIITRIWFGSTNFSENALEQLQEYLDNVSQNFPAALSAPATHAAQTVSFECFSRSRVSLTSTYSFFGRLWKPQRLRSNTRVLRPGVAFVYIHYSTKLGRRTKPRFRGITGFRPPECILTQHRKIVQCALAQLDFDAARSAHAQMTESSRDEPVTRYLMYKVGLQSGDTDFGKCVLSHSFYTADKVATECLDHICRSSVKDATLLYACVMEAQSAGNKRQAINALRKVLEKYEHGAPAGIHLPALLR